MKRKELGEASVRRNYAFSQRTIEKHMRTMYEMSEEASKPSISENPDDSKTSKKVKVGEK